MTLVVGQEAYGQLPTVQPTVYYNIEAPLHLELGTLLLACSVASVGYIGCYLYGVGFSDFERGLKGSGAIGTCPTYNFFELLSKVAPFFCMVRILLAPAVWSRIAIKRYVDPFVLIWLVCFLWPAGMLMYATLAGWIGDMLDAKATIDGWNPNCKLERPVHGLLQTRCGALGGSFLCEAAWYGGIAWFGNERFFGRLDPRGSMTGYIISVILFYYFMLEAGPKRFYFDEPVVDQLAANACRDGWIVKTYLFTTIGGFALKLILFLMPRMLPMAIHVKHRVLGPYAHFSTWIWWGIHGVQLFALEYCMQHAEDLKVASPFSVCGRDYAEFFVPRFYGLIYFLYAEFLMFNFWLVGATFSSGEPVFMMRMQ